MTQPVLYVALLRGINVGGKNPVPMKELKASFESLGFEHVQTYIQSGNVLFTSAEKDRAALTRRIEDTLSRTFDYHSLVVLRSHHEMKAIVEGAPEGYGTDPATYRYDVIFVKEPLTVADAMKIVSLKDGVDRAFAGESVIYFERLVARLTQSRVNKIVGTPEYRCMTLRNWNTTSKLLTLMEAVDV